LFSALTKNSSWYDAFWSVIPVVLVILCWMDADSGGNSSRALLMMACLLFWSVRLTFNWMRSWDGFAHEDWRYVMMKAKARNKLHYFAIDFGLIHLIPTICVYLALLPMNYAYFFHSADLSWIDWMAFIISISAVLIQSISDEQMYQFRHSASLNKPQTMQKGLWFYSRHPNYFGEIIFWFSLFIFITGAGLKIVWLIIGSIVMYALIAIGSVAMMDKRSSERRSDYGQYLAATPAIFLNLLKRKNQ